MQVLSDHGIEVRPGAMAFGRPKRCLRNTAEAETMCAISLSHLDRSKAAKRPPVSPKLSFNLLAPLLGGARELAAETA